MLQIILLLCTFAQVSCNRSFTLVLDTTNSMEAEILVVRANIGAVLSDLKTYNNFVLVPFKDSAVEQIFTTPSVQEYLSRLNSITTSGGADCPEDSLAGIEAALRASDKQSTIFVFTDGYAKDGHRFRTVETLCKETHSQVIIFLNGYCSSPIGNVDVYYDIARACSGSMLKWDSLVDLREAFKYMKEVVNTEWTNVTTHERFTNFKQLSFSVDRFTTDLMLVASGLSPVVQVVGSSYQHIRMENVIRTKQPKVVRITPEIGEYKFNVHGQGPISVTFYERKFVPFEFGFSTKSPRNIRETRARPIAGWTNYILINVDDSIKLRSVEWLNLGDSVKQILLLKRIPSGSYVSSVFVEQGKIFRFWIIGEDGTNQREIKGTSTFLAPQVPVNENNVIWMKPEAEILDTQLGLIDFGSTLTLAAEVVGFPKPDIHWRVDDNEISSETILLEIPSVFISYVTIPNVSKNSTISCHARNDEGEVEISIDVFVNRTLMFEVILSPEDAYVEFGSEHRIDCQIDAYPEANIKWYLNDSLIDNTNARLSLEGSNAVVIKEMGFEDIGSYECRASNGVESKTLTANIEITGVEPPEIDETDDEIQFKPSDLLKEIKCRITKGKPVPEISWKYKPFDGPDFNSLPYGASNYVSDIIAFEKIDRSHGGVYRCIASNAMGEATKDFIVKVLTPPVIKNSEVETISVRRGYEVHLPCEVEATPPASVRWEMSQDDVMIHLDARHRTDDKHTHHFRAQPIDSGNYHCVAENTVGRAERTVIVNVLVPPYIEPQPERFYTHTGDSVTLPCNVLFGNPTPTIRWEFRPKDSTTFTRLVSFRGNSTSALKIGVVSKRDEGSYVCIAENELNTDNIKYDLVVQQL